MKMESTIIKSRILVNILDMQHSKTIISNHLINLEDEVIEYYDLKLNKALYNSGLKEVIVGQEHHLLTLARNMIIDDEQFIAGASELTNDLMRVVKGIPEMPDSSLLFVECNKDGEKVLAILKLNYKVIAITKNDSKGIKIVNVQSLPPKSSNVEEAIIVNLDRNQVFIIEKKFMIDGKNEYYLNSQYIKGEPQLTDQQKINLMTKVIKKVDSEFNICPGDPLPVIKKEIKDLVTKHQPIVPLAIAKKLAKDDYNAQKEAEELMQDLGIGDDEIPSVNLKGFGKLDRCKLILDDERIVEMPLMDYLEKIDMSEEESTSGRLTITLKNIEEIKIK